MLRLITFCTSVDRLINRLQRRNGPHGEYNDRFDPMHPHAEYHVHLASEEAIRSGLRAENRAAKTEEFASYREALAYFLRATNILNAAEYFPDDRQVPLPFPPHEEHGS